MAADPLLDPVLDWDVDELDDDPDMWERVDHDYDAYTDLQLDLL